MVTRRLILCVCVKHRSQGMAPYLQRYATIPFPSCANPFSMEKDMKHAPAPTQDLDKVPSYHAMVTRGLILGVVRAPIRRRSPRIFQSTHPYHTLLHVNVWQDQQQARHHIEKNVLVSDTLATIFLVVNLHPRADETICVWFYALIYTAAAPPPEDINIKS